MIPAAGRERSKASGSVERFQLDSANTRLFEIPEGPHCGARKARMGLGRRNRLERDPWVK